MDQLLNVKERVLIITHIGGLSGERCTGGKKKSRNTNPDYSSPWTFYILKVMVDQKITYAILQQESMDSTKFGPPDFQNQQWKNGNLNAVELGLRATDWALMQNDQPNVPTHHLYG